MVDERSTSSSWMCLLVEPQNAQHKTFNFFPQNKAEKKS